MNKTINDIQEIIRTKHDTKNSFYIIYLDKLRELYKLWESLLPNVKPYYAVKCNPNKIILNTLSKLGVNFDCASYNEIKKILDITNDPTRIIFANPCKTTDDIKYASEHNIYKMTFDCKEELDKIKTNHPNAELILRLSVDDNGSIIKFSTKFGTPITDVEYLIQYANTLNLKIIGFSFHIGSKCKNPENYYKAIQTCKHAFDIAKKLDINIKLIDIGGGFSILDKFEESAVEINRGIHNFFKDDIDNGNIQFIAEPGRFFVETTHTLVVSVIGKKVLNNKSEITYTVNESIYHSFNCIIFDYANPVFQYLNNSNNSNSDKIKTRIFGYTCDSIDKLIDSAYLPELNIGDWLFIENFGAYTYSASSQFNGFKGTQQFYCIDNGKIE